MTAVINFVLIDPPGLRSTPADLTLVEGQATQAFNEWARHFDYTSGVYTIGLSFYRIFPGQNVRLDVQDNTTVGSSTGLPVVETSFGLSVADRAAGPLSALGLVMSFNGGASAGSVNIVGSIEREFGHALGIRSLTGPSGSNAGRVTTYDLSVGRSPPQSAPTFIGPYAEAAYGGPVPVSAADLSIPAVDPALSVEVGNPGFATIQPLDVALLRDAGLPALSDQEMGEHQVARLYVAALGRNADGAGLMQQYAALRSGESLAQVAAGLTSSAEYANLYGNLSNPGFVNALYQNVLGRAGDAAGVQNFVAVLNAGNSRSALLAGFADGDEARGYLNSNPNVTYAATAEAQVARLYDTAFGRGADPAGFDLFTTAIINGATIQQAALSFLASPEFANRYGASPSNQALVDGLYQNTLHRAPDAAGEALHVNGLASGQLSRAGLLASFSDGQEHINLMAQAAGARSASGYNTDLAPQLGIIPVIGSPVIGSPVIGSLATS